MEFHILTYVRYDRYGQVSTICVGMILASGRKARKSRKANKVYKVNKSMWVFQVKVYKGLTILYSNNNIIYQLYI